jgi:hypothetical protein
VEEKQPDQLPQVEEEKQPEVVMEEPVQVDESEKQPDSDDEVHAMHRKQKQKAMHEFHGEEQQIQQEVVPEQPEESEEVIQGTIEFVESRKDKLELQQQQEQQREAIVE